jgi:hypothetical protein
MKAGPRIGPAAEVGVYPAFSGNQGLRAARLRRRMVDAAPSLAAGEYQGATTTAARALLFGRRATPAIADWGSARRCAVCSCWSSPAQARIGPSLVPASWRSSSAVVSKATPSQLARPGPGMRFVAIPIAPPAPGQKHSRRAEAATLESGRKSTRPQQPDRAQPGLVEGHQRLMSDRRARRMLFVGSERRSRRRPPRASMSYESFHSFIVRTLAAQLGCR